MVLVWFDKKGSYHLLSEIVKGFDDNTTESWQ